MARIVKSAAERRAELLDYAEELFFRAGYETTTVADIIERAGVSKGGFYHHFESKEALLDALADRVAAHVMADAREALDTTGLQGDALARLNAFLSRARHWKTSATPRMAHVFYALTQPENAVLIQRLTAAAMEVLKPILDKLIRSGVAEGLFDAPHAEVVTDVLLQIATGRQPLAAAALAAAQAGDVDGAVAMVEKRIAREEAVIDRLLGLPPGSVRLAEPGFVRATLVAMLEVTKPQEEAAA